MSDQRSRILAYLREAVQASRAADPQRGRRLAALGVALLTPPGHRASDPLPMPPPGITAGERDQAIDYLNQAADLLAETPGRQLAASVLIVLARLRRARGNRSRDDHGQARQAAARRHDRRQRGGPPARRRRARAGAGMVPGGDERRG